MTYASIIWQTCAHSLGMRRFEEEGRFKSSEKNH